MDEQATVMDNGGVWGKYILQDLQLPAIHSTPEAIEKYEKAGRKRIHWMDGHVMPGAFQINTAWYYEPTTSTWIDGPWRKGRAAPSESRIPTP